MRNPISVTTLFSLADVEMTSLPIIPLKILTQLDLSGNRLADVPFLSAEGVPNLRHLNLSRNQVSKSLEFSYSNIRVPMEPNSLVLGRNGS